MLNLDGIMDVEAVHSLIHRMLHGDDAGLKPCIILMKDNFFYGKCVLFSFKKSLKQCSNLT